MNNDFKEIIRCAVRAPSGHNTQPWRFKIDGDTINVTPDFGCALPVVDPDNREMYISLGCAMENMMVVAHHFGYEAHGYENLINKIVAIWQSSNHRLIWYYSL